MKVHTGVKWAVAVMLMVVPCFSVTVTVKDYGLHQETIDDVNLEDKVASIRAKENCTTFGRLSETYVNVMLSMEDHRFYNHPGIDVIVIGRAVFNDIKAGFSVKGAGTVTQQLAKNMYFSQEKELIHKAVEVLVAFGLERNYSRDGILELHANTIYYGDGYYYVKDTSSDYFGEEPEDMTDYESTLLAGIPNAPSCYVLTMSQELTARRQQQILDRLVKCGYFTEERALETMAVGSSRW